MEQYIKLLISLEILVANLIVIDRCAVKRYKAGATYTVMAVFALIFVVGAYAIVHLVPIFRDGNGLFIFLGLLFLGPLVLLYETEVVKLISISATAWLYTFLLYALAVHLSGFAKIGFLQGVFWFQTVLYLLTFYTFYHMVCNQFTYIINHLPKEHNISLVWMSIIWFCTIFIVNLSFVYPAAAMLKIISFLLLGASALFSYQNIGLMVNGSKKIQRLETLAYQDELTQLRSRAVLSSDLNDLITRKIPFNLIYIDLNRFKSVNDLHGHAVGDEYLYFFAQETKKRLGSKGGFYRIAGDEFVCLYLEYDLKQFIDSILALPSHLPGSEVRFLGFSFGISHFPNDARDINELLRIADERMYEMKNKTPF